MKDCNISDLDMRAISKPLDMTVASIEKILQLVRTSSPGIMLIGRKTDSVKYTRRCFWPHNFLVKSAGQKRLKSELK
jgi:hypothetical protein